MERLSYLFTRFSRSFRPDSSWRPAVRLPWPARRRSFPRGSEQNRNSLSQPPCLESVDRRRPLPSGAVLLAAGGAMVFGIIGWAGALMHVPRPAGGFPRASFDRSGGLVFSADRAFSCSLPSVLSPLRLRPRNAPVHGRRRRCAALGAAGAQSRPLGRLRFGRRGGRYFRGRPGSPALLGDAPLSCAAAAVFIPFLVSLFLRRVLRPPGVLIPAAGVSDEKQTASSLFSFWA